MTLRLRAAAETRAPALPKLTVPLAVRVTSPIGVGRALVPIARLPNSAILPPLALTDRLLWLLLEIAPLTVMSPLPVLVSWVSPPKSILPP